MAVVAFKKVNRMYVHCPLLKAAQAGASPGEVRSILEQFEDSPWVVDRSEQNAMHLAAKCNKPLAAVEVLRVIDSVCPTVLAQQIVMKGSGGMTPLHMAVSNAAMVRFLVEELTLVSEAVFLLEDRRGKTAIDRARDGEYDESVAILQAHWQRGCSVVGAAAGAATDVTTTTTAAAAAAARNKNEEKIVGQERETAPPPPPQEGGEHYSPPPPPPTVIHGATEDDFVKEKRAIKAARKLRDHLLDCHPEVVRRALSDAAVQTHAGVEVRLFGSETVLGADGSGFMQSDLGTFEGLGL